MKQLYLILGLFVFVLSSNAETNYKDLQSLTNVIAITHHRTVMTKLLPQYLKVLEAAEKGCTNAPKAETVADAIDFTNAYFTTRAFDNKPLSELIPELFELLENDELTDHWQVFLDGKYTNTYGEWVYQIINTKLNIDTRPLEEIDQVTMLWFPRGDGRNPWSYELAYFWYYSGLKHLPTLWNDWYYLWKLETKRDVPRTNVLERLSREISRQFSYHLFPFVAKAIEDGDKTLEILVEKLPHRGVRNPFMGPLRPSYDNYPANKDEFQAYYEVTRPYFTNSTSFVSWWNNEKNKYIIQQPDRKISDLKHILKRKCRPNVFDEVRFKETLIYEKALDDYCALNERPISNCWYFSIKGEDESTQK